MCDFHIFRTSGAISTHFAHHVRFWGLRTLRLGGTPQARKPRGPSIPPWAGLPQARIPRTPSISPRAGLPQASVPRGPSIPSRAGLPQARIPRTPSISPRAGSCPARILGHPIFQSLLWVLGGLQRVGSVPRVVHGHSHISDRKIQPKAQLSFFHFTTPSPPI